ncbi:MAG: PqqD family protein [Lachnospiraceae bacterium]|nr:PqqD family protein [Lachnospiraceae bacterium]
MRLKEGFITHETNGEQVMVGTGKANFSGLVRSNATAAFIVDTLKTDTTKEEIVKAMAAKYDAPQEVIEKDVERILETLRGIGAIQE